MEVLQEQNQNINQNNLKYQIQEKQQMQIQIQQQGEIVKQKQFFKKKSSEEIDDLQWQVFDLIRGIKDPEFPKTLEQLKVIQEENIKYIEKNNLQIIQIIWVPTVPNCHLANQIGLSIITKLQNELLDFEDYKMEILVQEGKHLEKELLDKQINDKERIAAAQENPHLMEFINSLIHYEER